MNKVCYTITYKTYIIFILDYFKCIKENTKTIAFISSANN